MHETIAPPSVDFVAAVAAQFLRSYSEAGRAPPDLTLSLDDLWAAYRRIPCADAQFSVVALWSVKSQRVLFFPVFGHNFSRSSQLSGEL